MPESRDITEFLKELKQLCDEHNVSLSTEDSQGAIHIIDKDEWWDEHFQSVYNDTTTGT